MEGYGDIHLHQSDYADFPGQYTYEGKCRYNALDHKLYDNYIPTSIPGMDKCHVEYCHPGSWQGKNCGMVKAYTADDNQVTCQSGVYGDEPVGHYDEYNKQMQIHIQQKETEKPTEPAFDMLSGYNILLWIFVILAALVAGKMYLKARKA